MKRKVAWPVLLTALVLTVVSGLLLPGPAAAESISGESTAYTNLVTGGDGPRTPDTISTSANNAVVVWREGLRPGNRDMGYIRYAYTTDGGTSWSRPQTLGQETSEYAYHYVILYQAGSELFAYMGRTPIVDTTEPDGDGWNNDGLPISSTVVKRSTDEGRTWQDYSATFPNIGNLVFAGRPLKLANGNHAIPYWATNRENGVLVSKDLRTWTKAGSVTNGNVAGIKAGENQISLDQDGATGNELVMVARSEDANAMKATSSDGGVTWTAFDADINLPSLNTSKAFFIKDSNGQYLYIYNTPISSPDSDAYRDILNYRTKRPGAAWSDYKFFADGFELDEDTTPAGTGKGWDTYAMADEYAPGKFYVVWEFDTTRIKVNKLDISDAS
ncbi:sialidase family protein [Streptomyces sp. NPDC059477]|uniref:sialidase family protein n=1 Tax=Streptomyces sp. NPDC059477 TaxID=3346847 RepID=UPI0036820C5B